MMAAQKKKEVEQVATKEKETHKRKEDAAKVAATKVTIDKEHTAKEAIVEVKEFPSQHTKDKMGSDVEGGGGEE